MISFTESIKTCLQKSFKTSGRASRSEYWWFKLFTTMAIYTPLIIGGIFDVLWLCILSGILCISLFLPMFCVTVRRLHDTGRPGEYILLNLIPYVGGVIVFVLMLLPGEYADNPYALKE